MSSALTTGSDPLGPSSVAAPSPSVRQFSSSLVHVPFSSTSTGQQTTILQTGPCDWLMSPSMSLALNWIFLRPASLPPEAEFIPAKKLATTLERLLQHNPWLAGRLSTGKDGRVNVDGTDMGVPFVLAETDCCLTSLPLNVEQYINTRMFPESLKLVADLDSTQAIKAPPLQIQHTRFACGGVAIGVRMSHILADGDALFTFMRHWSELYESDSAKLSVPPSLERSWTIPSTEEVMHRMHGYEENVLTTKPAPVTQVSAGPHSPSILNVFRFPRTQLQHLKELSQAGETNSPISTYQALCAWLLQRIYRARIACGQLCESEVDQPVKFVFAVNWRRRLLDPSVPPNYFGNGAVQLAMLTTLRSLLRDSIPSLAKRLHTAVSAATSDRIKSTLAWITSNSTAGRAIRWDINPDLDMASTDWSKMGMYRMTFDGAAPLRICLPYFTGYDGSIMLHSTPGDKPGSEGDAIDVYLGLTEAAATKLVADPEWQRLRRIV